MCDKGIKPDSLEQEYYTPYLYSMTKSLWTDDNLLPFQWNSMGADTCFKVEGNMWYEAPCLQEWQFDTNMHTNAIGFEVNLGHDILWTGTPVTLTATPDGGTPPYYYIWYDEDNRDFTLQSPSTSNTYTATFATRIEVLAIDGNLKTAMDYINVYKDTCGPTGVATIPKPDIDLRIFPNPSHGIFNIQIMNDYGRAMNIEVYNIMGEEIRDEELHGNSSSIDLSKQADGVYFCRLTDNDGKLLKSAKMIVIH